VSLDHEVCEKAGELIAQARRAGKTVPLGDGLHGAGAFLEGLIVATTDLDHFKALGVAAINPME
jgi:predicted nucleic acid-binding protein